MIGAVGSDDSGAWLRGIVTSEGIGDAGVRTVEGPSGTALPPASPGIGGRSVADKEQVGKKVS
jgi:sugar/nucleoside kinase (ribokinase family)